MGSVFPANRWMATGLLLLIVPLSGCAGHFREWMHNGFKVGPDYMRPAAQVANQYIDVDDPRVISENANYSYWWTTFNDPCLNSLVQTAYQQNLSLRVAAFRVLEARAAYGIARGNLFPQQQDVFGEYQKTLSSENTFPGNLPGFPRSAEFANIGFDATWELDIWGRFRRSIESEEANLNATIEDYDAVLVTLVADVAATYVEIRTVEQQLAYQLKNVEIQKGALGIAKARVAAGATSDLDVKQAQNNLANTEAAVPALRTQVRQAKNRLCVLLGMPPHHIDYMLGHETGPAGKSVIPVAPAEIAVGIPADLLRRRPDVRAAERRVAAQCARIGVAASDLFPSFSIAGSIGYESTGFRNLLSAASNTGFIAAPSINWPVLNYGRIRNNIDLQEARYQQLAAEYEQTVLAANQEVEDSLVAFLNTQEQYQKNLEAVQAVQDAVTIAVTQYRTGETDFNRVFLIQNILVTQQFKLAATKGNIALSLIGTYKALGGGWQIRLNPPAVAGGIIQPARATGPGSRPTDDATLLQPPEVLPPPAEKREAAPVPPALPMPLDPNPDDSALRVRNIPQVSGVVRRNSATGWPLALTN